MPRIIDRQSRPPRHLSGHLHVTGQSLFIGEGSLPAGLLHLKVLVSQLPHARILKIDGCRAKNLPDVKAVLTWRDIRGENQIGHAIKDEPLLPETEVYYAGQPVALVAAESSLAAERALAHVTIEYQELEPLLTIEAALARRSFYVPPRIIERGDVESALSRCDHVLEGEVSSGAQEHFYLETQVCLAVPNEDRGMTLYAATQSTAEVQEVAARILGVNSKEITVDVPRLGGGFGGKERQATLWACLTALASQQTGRPVLLRLSRHQDMAWTGKRHPFMSRYRVGFDSQGRIHSYSVELNANGGAYADLSVAILERAMLHADNAYHLPNARIIGRACRTHLPPNTAMRGFGAPQGIFVIEKVIERIARTLKLDPLKVRELNAYREGQSTPYGQPVREARIAGYLNQLKRRSNYQRLLEENRTFNRRHPYLKRGVGVVPVKFGISFTSAFLNQGSALIWIYADGSIFLSHGGVEMGQEVNTKVAQVAARELGVSIGRIRVESANTKRVANASPTAASTGSDLNGHAAREAARILKKRLATTAVTLLRQKFGLKTSTSRIVFDADRIWTKSDPRHRLRFEELIEHAYHDRVDLGAHGFYRTPGVHFGREQGSGRPFHYFAQGCGLVQVEVDILSGHSRMLRVHIVHELARSLNPEIDRGQIHGAFIQGFGWCTMEEEAIDEKGRYLAVSPSTYKIPTIRDLPDVFTIELAQGKRRYASVFGSKAIGEPPLIYGEAAWFAIKDAIESLAGHRLESGLVHPATPEAVLSAVESLKNQEDKDTR